MWALPADVGTPRDWPHAHHTLTRTQTLPHPLHLLSHPTPFPALPQKSWFPQQLPEVSVSTFAACRPRGAGEAEGIVAIPEAGGAEPPWKVGMQRPEEPESAAARGVI